MSPPHAARSASTADVPASLAGSSDATEVSDASAAPAEGILASAAAPHSPATQANVEVLVNTDTQHLGTDRPRIAAARPTEGRSATLGDSGYDSRARTVEGRDCSLSVCHAMKVGLLVVIYIIVSAGLIALNKYLMGEGVFPFPATLVLIHLIFNVTVSNILYALYPSFFVVFATSASKREREMLVRRAVPIALLFTLELIFSNAAYMHSSIPFLQMMKESSVVWVYILSVAFALETFSWKKCSIITVALFATTLTIDGETNFSLAGFLLQGAAISSSSLKTVLQGVLLYGPGHKLDAASFVLIVMPLCLFFLAVVSSLFLISPWRGTVILPSVVSILHWGPHILLSAAFAAGVNYTIAVLIQYTSAMGFVLTGIVKDGSILCFGWFMMESVVSRIQLVGFALQMSCVVSWALLKLYSNSSGCQAESGLAVRENKCNYGTTSSLQKDRSREWENST